MKPILKKHLWFYPMLFGLLGALLGLFIRYFSAYTPFPFSIKNVIHSHSHIMLLGLLFNGLAVLIWNNFTEGIDKKSYKLFLALQVCLVGMLIAFVLQGYAFFSILFSTLHLWLSYVFLIRLWKRLNGNKVILKLIKLGVIFHFVSSLGPYCLGPLMVFEMQNSPWYNQAVFFYLHFQFFGLLFLWFLALLFNSIKAELHKNLYIILAPVIVGLFAHSLDYSFDHWLINTVGGISSLVLSIFLLGFVKTIRSQSASIQFIYAILLFVCICNILGSLPFFALLVIDNHMILIAWLHLLFLGMYLPFIWINSPVKVSKPLWSFYFVSVLASELLLLFPEYIFSIFHVSIMKLLFFTYLAVTLCISFIHFRYLFLRHERHL